MSLCSTTELNQHTGATYTSTILTEIIAEADREISARLAVAGLTAPSSDDKLKSASLNLSIAGVLTRKRIDGSKPANMTGGKQKYYDDIDSAIKELRQTAMDMINSYIKTNGSSSQYRYHIRKANS